MTHCERVLNRLRQGPASHLELYRLGVIAHSRVSDLRKRGYRIDQHREGDLYIYELGAEPVPQSGSPEKRGEGCQLPESAPTHQGSFRNWRWLLSEAGEPDGGDTAPVSGRPADVVPSLSEQPSLLGSTAPTSPPAGAPRLLNLAAVHVIEGADPGGSQWKGRSVCA